METMLDTVIRKAAHVMCPEECHVYTCPMNCAVYNLREHIKNKNYVMIFGYYLLLQKYGKLKNPVESH